MPDRFSPIGMEQLCGWVFTELEERDSLFGIPRRHFFVPSQSQPYRTRIFGHSLETPIGPAAGPHTQMAQNIVCAWLCGARYIELKTVQTLDEIDVSKPCIDMEDEGYNVEWSQELRVRQSFDEYLRAWVLIHALHRRLGFPGDSPGVVFNLSVGYDLEGIRQANMQWFLDSMDDCSESVQGMIGEVARHFPAAEDLCIPSRISDNVTLSTMHGCPPDEIGSICRYLLEERGLHTYVKLNPTLLGPDTVRGILADDLGYREVTVPDQAFEHDLEWAEAVPLLRDMQASASARGLEFGIKLSNTLAVKNFRRVFDPSEKMMYLSGRPLHAITVNLADRLAQEFHGRLPTSFSAGADCFNTASLLAAGMLTVTTCSDLLKTGGYLRLLQYLEVLAAHMADAGAAAIDEFILASCPDQHVRDKRQAALSNLRRYAVRTRSERLLKKDTFQTSGSKTRRELGLFDCIKAPCTDRCAIDQKVPQYMAAVRRGDYPEALALTRRDNPIPVLLARACDHLCEPACVRTHLDEPLAIRHIKRFIMEQEPPAAETKERLLGEVKVAVIGAGPGGLAAASELAHAGIAVEIFEQHGYAGGMVGGAIPEYRLPQGVIDQDLAVLERLGVKISYGQRAGRDFTITDLRRDGFDHVVIAVGAQLGKSLGLEGEDSEGVIDALEFLRRSREHRPLNAGPRIGIVGAGDTAMDCARTAWRRAGDGVSIIYRRSLDQMPADREEIRCMMEEGIRLIGMAKPHRLKVEGGRLRGLVCRRMEYRGDRDASGRKIPYETREEFEVPLDTLILAVSQHALLDFFGAEQVGLNRDGFIETAPDTFETSLPGVYAGGDVANDGPSSIVRAVADGKAIAQAILGRNSGRSGPTAYPELDTAELLRRRGARQWRVPVQHTHPEERRNFNEVVLAYSEDEARMEASRCLDCHRYCSLCVGVCPNLALQTLQVEPFKAELPEIRVGDGGLRMERGPVFRLHQCYQIAVLHDLCNECGNCTTFCPTAGAPYRDKPRLFLNAGAFEAERDNAFMVSRGGDTWTMRSRWSGETHRLDLNGVAEYSGPAIRALIDPAGRSIESIEYTGGDPDGDELSLQPCWAMLALLEGVRSSSPHLPAMHRSAS